MKLSKAIEVLTKRQSHVAGQREEAEPDSGRYHRLNAEHTAIETALPILRLELAHRHAAWMDKSENAEMQP